MRRRKRPKLEPYDTYLARQGGKEICLVCGTSRSRKRRLDRDHDHKTGKARGLLCSRCNQALEYWIDSKWLLAAAAYLAKYESK